METNSFQLLHAHLAKIDEIHEGGEVAGPHVREEEDGVLRRVDGAQDVLEVAGARAQDDAVRLHRVAIAGQRHVRKVLVLPVGHSSRWPELQGEVRYVV